MDVFAIEMPKTIKEELSGLPVNGSIHVDPERRRVYSTMMSILRKESDMDFTLRTLRDTGEVRVWRLK